MDSNLSQGIASLIAKLKRLQTDAAKDVAVTVGYTADYAVHVHEDIQAYHPVGQAKFLETPLRQLTPELRDMIREAMKKGMTLEQALLMAGLRLQRESQLLCPVDTGALRASVFTRLET